MMRSMLLGLLATSAVALAGPRVFHVFPDNGDREIDPGTFEIRIVFDQPMDTRRYAVVGEGPMFPKIVGDARWVTDSIFTIPVKLEPGHEYWLSLNSNRFRKFQDRDGEPLEPYPIHFFTGSRRSPVDDPVTPEQNRKAIEALRKTLDKEYAHRDRPREQRIDWDQLFKDNQKRLEESPTPRAFARQSAKMLAAAGDLHLSFQAGQTLVPTFQRRITANVNVPLFETLIPRFEKVNRTVWTGRYEDEVVYLAISSWEADREEDLKAAMDLLRRLDIKGLILDVRMNSGGSELLARKVAGCFVGAPVEYAKHRTIKAGAFAPPQARSFEPASRDREPYRGRVAVLTGPVCMSSCESFLLMMKQVKNAKLIGERTYGSSGNPQPHNLGNGVIAMVPSWQDLLPDGTSIEGQGITPDLEVRGMASDFMKDDPVLKRALTWVRFGQ